MLQEVSSSCLKVCVDNIYTLCTASSDKLIFPICGNIYIVAVIGNNSPNSWYFPTIILLATPMEDFFSYLVDVLPSSLVLFLGLEGRATGGLLMLT